MPSAKENLARKPASATRRRDAFGDALQAHVVDLWTGAGVERLKRAVVRELRGERPWVPDGPIASPPPADVEAEAMREHAAALREHAAALRETPPLVAGLQSRAAANAPAFDEATTPGATHYTSKPGGPHPPGKSQRWTVRNLKTLPGAYKVPGGRDWMIPVVDYDRWATGEDARLCAALAEARPTRRTSAVEVATRGLARAGFRPTRGGGHG